MRQPLRRPSARRAAMLSVRVAERQPTQLQLTGRPGVFPTYRAARRALLIAALAESLIAVPILASLTLLVLHLMHAIP